jgi:carboxyl-terminal processing protease
LRLLRPIVLVGVVAVAVSLAAACGSDRSSELDEIAEVIERVQENFIDQERASDEQLIKAAIDGIIEYLDDPYAAYLSNERYEDFSGDLTGERAETEFEGIGAEVVMRDDRVMILGPLPDSPAIRAGIRAGDVVLTVDGADVEGLGLLETVDLIRGPKGSEVVLGVLRAGFVQPVDIVVVRDTIKLSSISARIQDPGIGYINLDGFNEKTADGFRAAIASLRAEGAEGLILDLRGNTGGLVEAPIAVVSEFLPEGSVFIWRNADGTEEDEPVSGDGTAYDLPLVVLVDGFSASASEIVTGALQDHGRATIVGTKTFGKGSVNLLSELGSGAGLYLTISRWLTPNGRLIEGEGIEPDIVVGDMLDVQAAQRVGSATQSLCQTFEADREALAGQELLVEALDGLCNLRPDAPQAPEGDVQLDAAVVELRSLMAR